jgi:hypothetical protein
MHGREGPDPATQQDARTVVRLQLGLLDLLDGSLLETKRLFMPEPVKGVVPAQPVSRARAVIQRADFVNIPGTPFGLRLGAWNDTAMPRAFARLSDEVVCQLR